MSACALQGVVRLRLMCTPWMGLMSAHKDFLQYHSDALLSLVRLLSDIVNNARLHAQTYFSASASTCLVVARADMRLRDNDPILFISAVLLQLPFRTAGPRGRFTESGRLLSRLHAAPWWLWQ